MYDDYIGNYVNLHTTTCENNDTMDKDYGIRSTSGGNINSGVRRINKLKLFMLWTQYFQRISEFPGTKLIPRIVNLAQMNHALDRACIQKQYREDSDTKEK